MSRGVDMFVVSVVKMPGVAMPSMHSNGRIHVVNPGHRSNRGRFCPVLPAYSVRSLVVYDKCYWWFRYQWHRHQQWPVHATVAVVWKLLLDIALL